MESKNSQQPPEGSLMSTSEEFNRHTQVLMRETYNFFLSVLALAVLVPLFLIGSILLLVAYCLMHLSSAMAWAAKQVSIFADLIERGRSALELSDTPEQR